MKKLAVFLCAVVAAGAELVGFAGEKTIDWVALNGGTSENIFGSGSNFGTYEDGVATYIDNGDVSRLKTLLEVVDGRFRLTVKSSNNGAWYSPCFVFANSCDVTFAEAQQIVVPYKYISSGKGETGQHFLLIIGTTTGKKYFGVASKEALVKGEESVLTFDFKGAYSAYSADYAAVRDSVITVMRLYPYDTGTDITTGSTAGAGGRQRFESNDEIYVGAFNVKWTEATGFTATFDANGGEPVDDITTDASGAFEFPTATREGWTFMGWYRDGKKYSTGTAGTLLMDTDYVAGWRHADLTQGLIQTPIDYRKELDLYAAWGSCCEIQVGSSISYDPKTDVGKDVRASNYEVDTWAVDRGTQTNVLFIGMTGVNTAGNNSPELCLPPVGVTVKDAYEVKVSYRATGSKLSGLTMTLKYTANKTDYSVTSVDTMQVSEGDEFHTVKFKLAEALGEASYEKLKDATITAWKLHPYVGSKPPFDKGVSLEFGRIQLIGEHPNGLMLIIK